MKIAIWLRQAIFTPMYAMQVNQMLERRFRRGEYKKRGMFILKNILIRISRRLFVIVICFYIFQLTSCINSIAITPEESEYIYTEKDLFTNISDYKIIPYPNGKNYFYTKTKNNFGWYYLYSINCKYEQNNEIKIKTTINIFYQKKDIVRLYNSNVLLNSSNVIKNRELFDIYQFDSGNFISTENYKYISIIANKILYSIELEGNSDITIEELLEIINKKNIIINSKNLLY